MACVPCLPEANKITTLFQRRKTSTRGLKGFISFKESFIIGTVAWMTSFAAELSFSVQASFTLVSGESFRASTSCGPSMDWFRVSFSRCFSTFWYVKLRSWRNVSLKNRRKDRHATPETIARNQKIARQLNPVVNAPPNTGPNAYGETSTWDWAIMFNLPDQVLEQHNRCPSVIGVKWLTII